VHDNVSQRSIRLCPQSFSNSTQTTAQVTCPSVLRFVPSIPLSLSTSTWPALLDDSTRTIPSSVVPHLHNQIISTRILESILFCTRWAKILRARRKKEFSLASKACWAVQAFCSWILGFHLYYVETSSYYSKHRYIVWLILTEKDLSCLFTSCWKMELLPWSCSEKVGALQKLHTTCALSLEVETSEMKILLQTAFWQHTLVGLWLWSGMLFLAANLHTWFTRHYLLTSLHCKQILLVSLRQQLLSGCKDPICHVLNQIYISIYIYLYAHIWERK